MVLPLFVNFKLYWKVDGPIHVWTVPHMGKEKKYLDK